MIILLYIYHLSDELDKLSQLCSDRRVVTLQPYCVKKMRGNAKVICVRVLQEDE